MILLLVLINTALISIFHRTLNQQLVRQPLLLGLDLLFAAALLAASGGVESPYYFTALSPMLAGAFFFQVRGGLLATSAFALFYFPAMYAASVRTGLVVDLNALTNQMAGFGLMTLLFGYMSRFLNQLRETRDALASAGEDLESQNKEISLAHRQLKIAYDLTLLLQAATDVDSVQTRVLSAITGELGFSRAAVGVIEPGAEIVSGWHISPQTEGDELPCMPIREGEDIISQALHNHQEYRYPGGKPLSSRDEINRWVGQGSGLVVPLYLREHTIGVLLAITKSGAPALSDDRVSVVRLVAGQIAVALGTTMMCIDRAQQLAIEQERNRIARDIHDSVSQSLFGIAYSLDASINMLPEQAGLVKRELIELQGLANQARAQVRRSIFDLWPSDLTRERFETDLQQYVNGCSIQRPYAVYFRVSEDFDRLGPSIRRNLYRVTQEALANAARHSQSDDAEVCLSVEKDEVFLKISDQGRGFDSNRVLSRRQSRERFGLHGIQERIRGLGGWCEILSSPGHGTQILIRVPFHGNSRHA